MNLSVNIGWQWTAFGLMAAYHKEHLSRQKTIYIQFTFLAATFDWGY